MNILVFPHLGLGDQFIMNGYIHNLLKHSEIIEEICIIAKAYQEKTLKHLYSDYPSITFYWVAETSELSSSWEEKDLFLKSINRTNFGSLVKYKEKTFVLHNFGCHTTRYFDIHRTNWADAFYYQAGLDPKHRLMFVLPHNLEESKKLYTKVIKEIGNEYILIHDDPLRNRNINQELFKKITSERKTDNLPILYLGRNRYDCKLFDSVMNKGSNNLLECSSLIDYYDLIKNSKECHFMDSSISILTDFIEDCNSKLYNHQYITNEGNQYASSQKINILKNWVYL